MRNAHRRAIMLGIAAVVSASMLGVAPAATAGTDVVNAANLVGAPIADGIIPDASSVAPTAFPSASSVVVGSTGFIDGDEVGYFWSATRGDSVTQVIGGPSKIKKAILKVEVVYNGLVTGAQTDWDIRINGDTVGDFTVTSGQVGPIKVTSKFPRKRGGEYEVAIVMTNEVAGGEGSITLAYAGAYDHSIALKRR